MRIRITDGTNEVELKAKGNSRRRLQDAEDAAVRMLAALRDPQPAQADTVFGFTADRTLDGVSLDSSSERAEPYDDGRGYEGDGE